MKTPSIPAHSGEQSNVVIHPFEGLAALGRAEDLPSGGPQVPTCTDTAPEQSETDRMRAEIDRLYRELSDSRNALLTSNEHADLLQEHLYRVSTSLTAEIRERQATEEKLRTLLNAITREKGDLEVLVQILIDQGDVFAEESEKAGIDGLTQIFNRRKLDEYLVKEWGRHARLQQPLSLLLCDVDHFKLYNDRYGHQAGDECLRTVALAIKQCNRADDLVARYGGEEFAVVLPHTPRERAVQIAERVCSAVAAKSIPHTSSPIRGSITLSIGVACQTPRRDVPDARGLLEDADRSLDLAKYRGRNRVVGEDRVVGGEKENIRK
jgi:diguanylate cyclase (GGDEF)-like protein